MIRTPDDQDMVRGIYTLLLSEARDVFDELGDSDTASTISVALAQIEARDMEPLVKMVRVEDD